eukprot:4749172-Pleurochrysis_carterae.AAC.1
MLLHPSASEGKLSRTPVQFVCLQFTRVLETLFVPARPRGPRLSLRCAGLFTHEYFGTNAGPPTCWACERTARCGFEAGGAARSAEGIGNRKMLLVLGMCLALVPPATPFRAAASSMKTSSVAVVKRPRAACAELSGAPSSVQPDVVKPSAAHAEECRRALAREQTPSGHLSSVGTAELK